MLTNILSYRSAVRSKRTCHLDTGVLSWTCLGRSKVCGGSAHLHIESPTGNVNHFFLCADFVRKCRHFGSLLVVTILTFFTAEDYTLDSCASGVQTNMLQHFVYVSMRCSLNAVDF